MRPSVGPELQTRDVENLRQHDSRRERDQRGWIARRQQEPEEKAMAHERDRRRRSHQIEAHQSKRQTEPQLQAGQHRLRHEAGKPSNPAGQTENQQHHADHHAADGEPGWGDLGGEQDRRHSLHGLYRDRQTVVEGGGDIEGGETGQYRRRRQSDTAMVPSIRGRSVPRSPSAPLNSRR